MQYSIEKTVIDTVIYHLLIIYAGGGWYYVFSAFYLITFTQAPSNHALFSIPVLTFHIRKFPTLCYIHYTFIVNE